jgi:hypothetical protein
MVMLIFSKNGLSNAGFVFMRYFFEFKAKINVQQIKDPVKFD